MAKPRPVPGIDPSQPMRPNARRILRVRIDEVWSYEPYIQDPAHVRELHDMRIACKRLRYLLEIFEVAFPGDLTWAIEQVRELQDLLGDIHDRDVQVPMLAQHLLWLDDREARATQELLARRARRVAAARAPVDRERSYRAFRRQVDLSRRADERPGILALISRRRAERDELHAEFLRLWGQLRRERFRRRLERALGL